MPIWFIVVLALAAWAIGAFLVGLALAERGVEESTALYIAAVWPIAGVFAMLMILLFAPAVLGRWVVERRSKDDDSAR